MSFKYNGSKSPTATEVTNTKQRAGSLSKNITTRPGKSIPLQTSFSSQNVSVLPKVVLNDLTLTQHKSNDSKFATSRRSGLSRGGHMKVADSLSSLRKKSTESDFRSSRNVNGCCTQNHPVGNSFIACSRPCAHHSFITDVTDVRQMEQDLLKLLDDFHSGKLQAFGEDCTFEKLEQVREQQEKLARLHFDLGMQQDIYNPLSDEGRNLAHDNLSKLMDSLQQLSLSIDQLHNNPSIPKSVTTSSNAEMSHRK